MKWKVTVIQTVLESATVEIEVDWDFFDTVEEPVKAWLAEQVREG